MRWFGKAALALAAACLLTALGTAVPSAAQPASIPVASIGARLVVTIVTRSDEGKVFCALWAGPEGYPTQRRFAVGQARDRTIVDRQAHCAFAGVVVPGGEYAVAVFHDENANNDLDRGLFGIPTEGTGASNDARGFMGPPAWEHARFVFPDTAEHRITIRIAY